MEVKFNSPRGKFKITNIADDQVNLTPEDIPGASFIEEEIEKLTVSQLKFWLKCLRINQNRNEKELLENGETASDVDSAFGDDFKYRFSHVRSN